MEDRRSFLKKSAAAAAAVIGGPALLQSCGPASGGSPEGSGSRLIVPRGAGLRITGTFLDEISHDIPHQNDVTPKS